MITNIIIIIILIIFARANASPNFAHCLLMTLSDLEKRKHKNFLEKHYAGARAIIKQKLYGASLNIASYLQCFIKLFLGKVVDQVLVFSDQFAETLC